MTPTAAAATSPTLDRRRFLSAAGLAVPLALGLPGLSQPAEAMVDLRARRSGPKRVVTGRALTTSGLYAYPSDYLANRESMRGLGARTLRLSDADMDDATWKAIGEDGYDAHITVTTGDRADFATEQAWINDHLARLDGVLSRWPFRWVEIWNEPNFGMWGGATQAQRQQAYGNLLVAAYRFVKQRHPATGVIGFAAGGSSAAAPDFIAGVISWVPEAAQSFDVLSMHPYIAPVAPEYTKVEDWGSWSVAGEVKKIRDLGITKPIWFTEIGWPISESSGGLFATDAAQTVSPQQQAAYTVRLSVLAMRLGVERVHHMYVIDTDSYNGGFFTPAGARPQAAALAFQQQALNRPTAIRTVDDGRNGTFSYRVRTADGLVVVAWSDARRSLQVGPRAKVRDMYGAPVRVRGGRVRLGGAPVYVTYRDGSARRTSPTSGASVLPVQV